MRVALFATCLGDQFFAEACADTVRLLRHLGVKVEFPLGQTCCGQPAFNAGYVDDARRMALHTTSVFKDANCDYVVLPSGSCASMVRSHYGALAGNAESAADATALADRTFELSQFLRHVLDVESLGSGLRGKRIAYHHSCHALRSLGVDREPVELLRGAGAEVVRWDSDRECCGFGGIFSAKMPEVSASLADSKLESLPEADVVTSSDGGCLLQLQGRARQRGIDLPFQHLARLLWQGVDG